MNKLGRKKVSSEQKLRVGQRLKRAAQLAGIGTTTAMAEVLGINQGTISRYWTGERLPGADELLRYAQAVGKPAWWFWMDTDEEEFEVLAESLKNAIGRMMEGVPLAEAAEQSIDAPNLFSRTERRTLSKGEPALRARVSQAAGAPWPELPAERQRAIVDQLANQALPEAE